MASIPRGHNDHTNEENIINNLGEIVIKAHYRAEDGSAEMTYCFNCPNDVSRDQTDLWLSATGIYMRLDKSIAMINDMKALDLVEMTVHEHLRDEYGEVKVDKHLATYAY